MATWFIFLQVILDLGLLLGFFLFWIRLNRPQKEDPRLSRGLQLLQSKISILEDLSDRTDLQVRQLTALLSAKAVEVHQKTAEADRQIQAIEKNMQKSLELSKIFQDKIPHREIIERETSYKYIEAARMANQGRSADEISQRLGIPQGEVEIIVNLNREHLIFDESQVPVWARKTDPTPPEHAVAPVREMGQILNELPQDTLVDFKHPIPQPASETQPPPENPIKMMTYSEHGFTVAGSSVTVDPRPAIRSYQFPKIGQ